MLVGRSIPALSLAEKFRQQLYLAPAHIIAGYAVLCPRATCWNPADALLTCLNMLGLRLGKIIRTFSHPLKPLPSCAIFSRYLHRWNRDAVAAKLQHFWQVARSSRCGGGNRCNAFGLFVALRPRRPMRCFPADSWHNITFTAGDSKKS